MKRLTHFSLCSGIGGLDLAAEWSGFKTVAQCEIDVYASKVLAKNFKGVPNLNDIRTVTNKRLREYGIKSERITVISAGFPCQPYSLAGKGLGDSDSRDLWGEVARVLGEVKPRWFVGENTPGLFARENQRYFRRVLNDLTALGYSVGWGIWGACDVGAPHKRDRVFIIAKRNLADAFIKRRNTNEIQRREPKESGRTADKRRIQTGGLQFERVCGSISYPASYELGLFGSEGETSKIAGNGSHNRTGTPTNVGGEWWQTEPDVGRVANGIPARVDRLRCLGNAVVPYQALPIFEVIAEIELRKMLRG